MFTWWVLWLYYPIHARTLSPYIIICTYCLYIFADAVAVAVAVAIAASARFISGIGCRYTRSSEEKKNKWNMDVKQKSRTIVLFISCTVHNTVLDRFVRLLSLLLLRTWCASIDQRKMNINNCFIFPLFFALFLPNRLFVCLFVCWQLIINFFFSPISCVRECVSVQLNNQYQNALSTFCVTFEIFGFSV